MSYQESSFNGSGCVAIHHILRPCRQPLYTQIIMNNPTPELAVSTTYTVTVWLIFEAPLGVPILLPAIAGQLVRQLSSVASLADLLQGRRKGFGGGALPKRILLVGRGLEV